MNKVEGGRGDTIRTCDFQYPKLALYQAELRPDSNRHRIIAVADLLRKQNHRYEEEDFI